METAQTDAIFNTSDDILNPPPAPVKITVQAIDGNEQRLIVDFDKSDDGHFDIFSMLMKTMGGKEPTVFFAHERVDKLGQVRSGPVLTLKSTPEVISSVRKEIMSVGLAEAYLKGRHQEKSPPEERPRYFQHLGKKKTRK